MKDRESVRQIALAVATLAKDLDALEAAGPDIPAVVKNAVRMRGALRQLEVQFADLDALDL